MGQLALAPTLKVDALRPAQPETLQQAREVVRRFVEHYKGVRLHSAIGYIAALDSMAGKSKPIWAARDRKLDAARELRRQQRIPVGA